MVQFPRRWNLTFDNTLPIQSQGDSLHPRTLSGGPQETYNIYKCKGTDWSHPHIGFLPHPWLCNTFSSLGSTPVQGITNINRRFLHIGERKSSFFKARSVTQHFSKLASPDRNNIVTSVFDFLQPRHCSLNLFCSVSSVLPLGLCRLVMQRHPCQKTA